MCMCMHGKIKNKNTALISRNQEGLPDKAFCNKLIYLKVTESDSGDLRYVYHH